MHVIGRLDPMIEEERTLRLARKCRNHIVVYHPGSHYVPTHIEYLKIVAEFIQDSLGTGLTRLMERYDCEWEDI
jgi:hypothetical protein